MEGQRLEDARAWGIVASLAKWQSGKQVQEKDFFLFLRREDGESDAEDFLRAFGEDTSESEPRGEG